MTNVTLTDLVDRVYLYGMKNRTRTPAETDYYADTLAWIETLDPFRFTEGDEDRGFSIPITDRIARSTEVVR